VLCSQDTPLKMELNYCVDTLWNQKYFKWMAEGRFGRSKNLAELIAICIYFRKWHWELRLCVILYFIAFEGWNQDKQKATFFLGEIPSLGLAFFSSGWRGIVLDSKNTGSNIFVGGEAQIPWETMTFLGIFLTYAIWGGLES
jgi:hypothetical protein